MLQVDPPTIPEEITPLSAFEQAPCIPYALVQVLSELNLNCRL